MFDLRETARTITAATLLVTLVVAAYVACTILLAIV
jgi:hypothetical protein